MGICTIVGEASGKAGGRVRGLPKNFGLQHSLQIYPCLEILYFSLISETKTVFSNNIFSNFFINQSLGLSTYIYWKSFIIEEILHCWFFIHFWCSKALFPVEYKFTLQHRMQMGDNFLKWKCLARPNKMRQLRHIFLPAES